VKLVGRIVNTCQEKDKSDSMVDKEGRRVWYW